MRLYPLLSLLIIECNGRKIIHDLERIMEEAAISCFYTVSQHVYGGNWNSRLSKIQDRRCPDIASNAFPSQRKSDMFQLC
jgi:hypothetical protein